jgi:hypothetical protein
MTKEPTQVIDLEVDGLPYRVRFWHRLHAIRRIRLWDGKEVETTPGPAERIAVHRELDRMGIEH